MADLTTVEPALEVAAYVLKDSSNWWNEINRSPLWQDRIFLILAVLYGIVSVIALVQLIRIQLRVPEYGWTTQKVFHFLNFIVNGVRCLVFVFRRDVQRLEPEIIRHVVLDMPSLAFFTTYALLVLFWAEIYYQARAVSTDGLRPTFYTVNAIVYAIQIVIWLVIWWKPIHALVILSKMFFAGVSLFAALGFLLYGGRLFLMLKRFPVESKGRRKKLQEVGYVTSICFLCFLARCVMMCFNAFDKSADLDVLNHPILLMIYYMLVEILPSSLVLFILRKLPPKRGTTKLPPKRGTTQYDATLTAEDEEKAHSRTKLHERADGPFEVLEAYDKNAYKVALPESYGVHPTFNVSDLSPYFPPEFEDFDLETGTFSTQGGESDATLTAEDEEKALTLPQEGRIEAMQSLIGSDW